MKLKPPLKKSLGSWGASDLILFLTLMKILGDIRTARFWGADEIATLGGGQVVVIGVTITAEADFCGKSYLR